MYLLNLHFFWNEKFPLLFFLSTLEYLYYVWRNEAFVRKSNNKFDPSLKLTFQDMINGLVIFIGKFGSVPIPANWLPFFFFSPPLPRCQIGNREIIFFFFFLPSPLEIYEVEPNEFETKTRLSCNESRGFPLFHRCIFLSADRYFYNPFDSVTESDLPRFLKFFHSSTRNK